MQKSLLWPTVIHWPLFSLWVQISCHTVKRSILVARKCLLRTISSLRMPRKSKSIVMIQLYRRKIWLYNSKRLKRLMEELLTSLLTLQLSTRSKLISRCTKVSLFYLTFRTSLRLAKLILITTQHSVYVQCLQLRQLSNCWLNLWLMQQLMHWVMLTATRSCQDLMKRCSLQRRWTRS